MAPQGTDPLPDDKQAAIEEQIIELIKRGYKREDLWVNAEGRVLVDQDAGELEAHMKVFHPAEAKGKLPSDIANLQETIARQSDEIRKLKESENVLLKEQYSLVSQVRSLIASFPLGVIVIDKSQKIEAMNPNAEQLFQYKPREILGQSVAVIFPEVELLEVTTHPVSLMGRKKDGEAFATEIFVNNFAISGANKLFVSVQDITERHRLEQLRKELIGMVSHDIRAPLSSVLIALELVDKGIYGQLGERGVQVVGEAVAIVKYLSSMVVNLLDADKAENGTIEIELAETTIGEIVTKAVTAVRLSIESRSVSVESDFTNDVITADCDRIVQVLINLISNAIKFSPENSKVIVRAGIEGLTAKFQVIDEGPGIAPEMRAIIFERYRQLEQTGDVKHQGFGLGLAICKALVEKHNGRISVENGKNKGSIFTFVIPMSNH